jgi:hypothetical protein
MARLTGWCNGCWQWIRHPEGFHAHRWRFVATWIILFSLLTAYSVRANATESAENDQRFCDITSSYIESNLVLRDAQNQASVTAVGQRQALIEATDTIINAFLVPTDRPRTTAQRNLNRALITYLKAQNKLHQVLIDGGIETLVAAEEATLQWERLQRRLRC